MSCVILYTREQTNEEMFGNENIRNEEESGMNQYIDVKPGGNPAVHNHFGSGAKNKVEPKYVVTVQHNTTHPHIDNPL